MPKPKTMQLTLESEPKVDAMLDFLVSVGYEKVKPTRNARTKVVKKILEFVSDNIDILSDPYFNRDLGKRFEEYLQSEIE